MRARDAELDHRGAEVVEVLVQARLGVDAHDEVLDPLRRRRRRLHAQGVEVVGDRPRRSGTRSGSGSRSSSGAHEAAGRRRRAPKVPLGDVGIDLRQLALDDAERVGQRPPSPSTARARKSRSAISRPTPQDGRRAAIARRRPRSAPRAAPRPRRRPSPGSRARRAGSARPGRRSAAPGPRAGRPGSRRPPAAAPAPGRRARGPRRRPPPGGSATRSIRSTMSPDSIAAPACRNACASSRSIVRLVTPQNRPQRSRTYA